MQKKEEFVQIIKKNEGIIFKISRFYATESEDRKDLYQEIVFQLWKSFDSFKGESKMSTWIYRIALNTSITHLKKIKKKGHQLSVDMELMQITEEIDQVTEERMVLMHEQISKLNAIEKGVILLFLEGKSYEEIASITGFTVSNVGTKLGRIRQKLKSQLVK